MSAFQEFDPRMTTRNGITYRSTDDAIVVAYRYMRHASHNPQPKCPRTHIDRLTPAIRSPHPSCCRYSRGCRCLYRHVIYAATGAITIEWNGVEHDE